MKVQGMGEMYGLITACNTSIRTSQVNMPIAGSWYLRVYPETLLLTLRHSEWKSSIPDKFYQHYVAFST